MSAVCFSRQLVVPYVSRMVVLFDIVSIAFYTSISSASVRKYTLGIGVHWFMPVIDNALTSFSVVSENRFWTKLRYLL